MNQFKNIFIGFLAIIFCQQYLHGQTKRKLVWSDEFNYSGLPNPQKWNYDTGGNGWGNNELQYYTLKNKKKARVENGNLIIEALKETVGTNKYTSAR